MRIGRVLVVALMAVGGWATPLLADLKIYCDAVYFDLDRTLLDQNSKVPASSLKSIEHFRKCGGRVGIATGRTLEQARFAIDAVKPDLPVVLFNGAVVLSPGDLHPLKVVNLRREIAIEALKAARGMTGVVGVIVYAVDTSWPAWPSERLSVFAAKGRTRLTERWGASEQEWKDLEEGEVVKLLVYVEETASASSAESLRARLGSDARVIRSGPSTLEVVAAGVSKASAIRSGLEKSKDAPHRLVTFGDSGNDVEMLREFAMGIAMGNCLPEACEAAIARIGSHSSGDLAKVVKKYLVGPSCW
jgi:Cof subfamily protein (haloacid dehalogenase superfamily)